MARHIISLGLWDEDLGVFGPEATINRGLEMSWLGNNYMYFHFSTLRTIMYACIYRNPELIPC